MSEAELLLELQVVALDTPAQFGEINQTGKADGLWQRRQPILGRLLLTFGPFDQQPLLRPRFASLEVAVGDTDAQPRKARPERLIRALSPGDWPPCSGWQAERKVFDTDRLMLGIAESVAVAFVDTQWAEAVSFLVLFAFIIFRPNGIFGVAQTR